MVRLVGQKFENKVPFFQRFQFHNGAISRKVYDEVGYELFMFQFHNGAISRCRSARRA